MRRSRSIRPPPSNALVAVGVASVAVLGVAGLAWILFPRQRPLIAAAVVASPVPPFP